MLKVELRPLGQRMRRAARTRLTLEVALFRRFLRGICSGGIVDGVELFAQSSSRRKRANAICAEQCVCGLRASIIKNHDTRRTNGPGSRANSST